VIAYAALRESLRRKDATDPRLAEVVARALAAVAAEGEAAAQRLTAQYDGVVLTSLRLAPAVLAHARARVDPAALSRLVEAHTQGEAWGKAQREALSVPRRGAMTARWIPRPSVGLYLRRNGSGLDAAAFTLGVARAAGVKRCIAATPPSTRPGPPGTLGAHPLALALAAELELDALLLVGGAPAVALLGQQAGMVVGNGGAPVEEAKRQLAPRFPCSSAPAHELLIIADGRADLAAIQRALPSIGRCVVLALDGPLDLPGVEQAVVGRDQAMLLGQAWAPAQVALFVADADRWLGLFTDAGMVSVGCIAPFVPAPPLHAFLHLQPLQFPE
jgi:histidinol dehydrogenase